VQLGSGAWQRYQYDAAGRLSKVLADDNLTVLASYTYGASNARLLTEEAGLRTYYAWSGGAVIAEYSESGTQTAPLPANSAKDSLKGFPKWARDTKKADEDNVIYEYWYHTHPFYQSDGYKDPNIPSGLKDGKTGDIYNTNELGLPGVIVNAANIVVFDKRGVICTFRR
jgi:hypothetical protein